MSEIVPDDIMMAAQSALDKMPRRHAKMVAGEFWARVDYEVVSTLLIERKKWDGASTFKRCMEK